MTSPDQASRARIAVLSDRVRNQIAAGEVIERPASVVKELCENALDAGARHLHVELEEGGTRLIRVTDDGGGMPREDLELAFIAHATSKLFEVADLDHIASLGFRGEALASIGAVARCRIVTRQADAPIGWRIDDEGGTIGPAIEAGAPHGTSVEVRDLFFNVPARRRFLKRTATELAHVLDVLQRLALAHEGVGVTAMHDGRRLYDVEAAMDLRARIRRTFGADLADSLAPVDARDGDLSLSGYVAPPRLARADTSRQMWFLNGRALKDRVLIRALKEACRGIVFENRQAVAFLRLAMDPSKVDVNVHPTKAEVRFRDDKRLFGFLVHHLREAITRTDMATPGERLIAIADRREAALRQMDARFEAPYPDVSRPRREPLAVFEVASPVLRERSVVESVSSPSNATPLAHSPAPGAFLQVARTYIVRGLPDGFEVIDQHALHERVTYEGLLADLERGAVETQRWLVPELVELSRDEVQRLTAHLPALGRIGLDLAVFGDTTIAVHGLPARLARPKPELIVRDVLATMTDARAPESREVLEAVLQRAACRSSVMAGDELSTDEIRTLLERGEKLLSDQTCVHGRPTRVRFALSDLEKAFHRR